MTDATSRTQRRIGRRIGLMIALSLGLTMLAMIALSVYLERQLVTNSFDKQARISTQLLAANIGGAVKFKKADKVEEGVTAFLEELSSDVRWLAAVDNAGNIIFEVGEHDKKAEHIATFLERSASTETLLITKTTKAQAIQFGPKNSFVGGLLINWSHEQINADTITNAIFVIAVGALAACVAAVICIWQLTSLVVRPLTSIDSATSRLASGDYSTDVPEQSRSDEVGRLARNIERFRISLSSASQLQAEKEQAERAAASEKQATLDALETGIGSVVEAARLGSFEKRVDLGGNDDAIRGIGQGVNDLCTNISAFLNELAASLDALASGDISYRFRGGHDGQFAAMATQFNDAMERFSEMLTRISSTGDAMATSIEYVASGSKKLSDQTARQAAALEEANAAMDLVNTSVQANSARSEEIAEQTEEARQRATAGQSVVQNAVEAMNAIQQSSDKITEIISVIDDIAFQTNLLALNAAVEAARAGDAGKGFAVVASEVRTLAQKASESASDIKELIDVSTQKVNSGAKLVNETGISLERIMESIETVSGQIQEISVATLEQANGVNEISETVRSLEQNTARNAQFSDGTAAAAEKLEAQAAELTEISGMFGGDAEVDRPVPEEDIAA